MTPDLVYVLKPSRRNEELRFSLRSVAANLPHERVWTVGPERPAWISEAVGWIRTEERAGEKWGNIVGGLRAAVDHPDVASDFVYLNDDFFVMEPTERMPVYHRGPLAEMPGYGSPSSGYHHSLRETERMLEALGFDPARILSYELHVPLPVRKPEMAITLALTRSYPRRFQARSLYGNLWQIGGEYAADCKAYGPAFDHEGRAFISTSDAIFSHNRVGAYIRAAFPAPSRYER